ncbi:MAG: recombinase family protein [Candidatus Gracilibacteria bacterium]|nr:recombinase family protein [Candidatus Gracilibacteria bacterium]
MQDPTRSKIIKKLFLAYATSKYSLKYLQKLSLFLGLVSRYEKKPLAVSKIQKMLKNPFYYGVFIHKGEMYQGSHEPIISKQLFDKVQEAMKQRGKPRKAKEMLAFAFRGTFTCGECGRSITAEKKTKKSGRTYTYYRCAKKNVVCSQKYLEEQPLIEQLNELFQKVALNTDLKDKFLREWEKDYKKAQSEKPSAQNFKLELKKLEEKQMRLLDAYLDQTISETEYTKAKEKIINSKIDIKEKLNFGRKGNNWLEPFREWILSAHQAIRKADTENLEEKRKFLQKIGSNFRLTGQKVACQLEKSLQISTTKSQFPNWLGR